LLKAINGILKLPGMHAHCQAVLYETVPLRQAKYASMKNLSLLPMVFMLLTIFIGCNQEKSQQEKADELQAKVEEIHDVAMARIGTIRYYQDTLTSMLNQASRDSLGFDSARINKMNDCLQSINRADEQMMNWMRNYKSNNEEMEVAERIAYLQGEEVKVIAVRDSIDHSIAKAKLVIGNR
jgi:hypothetical protein